MSRNTAHYHNQGQEDYANGEEHSPPHGVLATTTETFAPVYGSSADARAENDAYAAGWENAKAQDK